MKSNSFFLIASIFSMLSIVCCEFSEVTKGRSKGNKGENGKKENHKIGIFSLAKKILNMHRGDPVRRTLKELMREIAGEIFDEMKTLKLSNVNKITDLKMEIKLAEKYPLEIPYLKKELKSAKKLNEKINLELAKFGNNAEGILKELKMNPNLRGQIVHLQIGNEVKLAKRELDGEWAKEVEGKRRREMAEKGEEFDGQKFEKMTEIEGKKNTKMQRQKIKALLMAKLRGEEGFVPKGRRVSANLVKTVDAAIWREFTKLHIAQIASPFVAVPPKNYGGTERVIYNLTEELVRRGHQVTLFASSESMTRAKKLISTGPTIHSLGLESNVARLKYFAASSKRLWHDLAQSAHKFDILHFHTHFDFDKHFDFPRHCRMPKYFDFEKKLEMVNTFRHQSKVVMTLHNLLSRYPQLCQKFKDIPLVSISDDQRRHTGINGAKMWRPNFISTVYHGIPKNLFRFVPVPHPPGGQPYLAFLGRFTEFKGPDFAIELAVKAQIRLKIGAKMPEKGTAEYEYWIGKVKPMIEANAHLVEYLGEVNDSQKNDLLGNANALLFPIKWPEPFGLVMIEAMACGTPVLTQNIGSVPEIIDDGVSGILFNGLEEGVEAIKRAAKMDRGRVRREFEARFTVERMADGYEDIFYRMAERGTEKLQNGRVTKSVQEDLVEENDGNEEEEDLGDFGEEGDEDWAEMMDESELEEMASAKVHPMEEEFKEWNLEGNEKGMKKIEKVEIKKME